MTATVVLGAQWGDEGKGKVTDFFASQADLVVRFQGGNNAGHTIVVENEKLALSLIPSGVLYENCIPVIASGCVIDLGVLIDEIEMLNNKDVSTSKLVVSANSHIIMPYHKILDTLIEADLGENNIGTTKRGIGPCYTDKIGRVGIRMQDFIDKKVFDEMLELNLNNNNKVLTKIYDSEPLDLNEVITEFDTYREHVKNIVSDTSLLIADSLKSGKNVIFEGAQGTLLDVDHGTYPFVTSSNTTSGNAAIGSGIGPLNLEKIVGVTKAYISRVGTGPFITEQKNQIGDYLIEKGAEFGTVTGRRRRCGWLDIVSLKYAVRVNSLSELFITKLDVLSGLEELKLCTQYHVDDEILDNYPVDQKKIHSAEGIYETFKGWSEDITGVRSFEELPLNAQTYLNRIKELIGIPITFISVGPERNQNIVITND